MIFIASYYYLLTNYQYLLGPPFDLITAEILFGIKLTRFRNSSGVIAFYYRCMQCFSSSLLFIVWFLTLVFSKPNKYSMGFRFEDWADQSRTPSMLVLPKRVINEDNNADSSLFMCFVEFKRPSQKNN